MSNEASGRQEAPDHQAPRLNPWWLVPLFLGALAEAMLFSHLIACANPELRPGILATVGGDTQSYLLPMDHLVDEGQYYTLNMQGEKTLAGRMPYYAVPYLLLRLAGLPAADIMAVLQAALFALALWALADLLVRETRSRWCGYLFMLAGGLSGHFTSYLPAILPDAIGASLAALAMHRFWLTEKRDRASDRWLLGGILAALILVKPYFAPLIALIPLRWLYKSRNLRQTAARSVILATPLLIMLAPWWIRNALVMGRFFPFQQDMYAGYGYSSTELRSRSFAQAAGEDGVVWWDPYSMASCMRLDPQPPSRYTWPEYFKDGTVAGFNQVVAAYKTFQAAPTPEHAATAEALMDSVQNAYIQQYPLHYYVTNHFNALPRLLFHSGSANLPVHASNPCYGSWQFLLKLAASLAYWASLAGLLLGIAWAFADRAANLWLWLVVPLYLALFFSLVVVAPEWRYFSGAFLIDLWLLFRIAPPALLKVKARLAKRT
ncbi:MAG: hypothetical protein JSS84_10875 [Bacteroidetes bacterium]|nr:hypothetical protein [Bacteroidota bacterium]